LPVFNKVTDSYRCGAIKPSKITPSDNRGKQRAGALLDEARHGMFGSLVIGRRGVSKSCSFRWGGSRPKLTQITNEMALWIVA